jgi:outer membrane protein OmpA-like peptidoglycan-associated protein
MASKKITLMLGLISLLSSAGYSQTSTQSDAGYDWRDSSKIATRNLPQQSEFLNNQYPYPARPRSQSEFGIHGGIPVLISDISPRVLSSIGGGISYRRALNHTWSYRLQYNGSDMKGMDYRVKVPGQIPGNVVGDPWRGNYGPTAANRLRNNAFVANYRSRVHQLAVDFIASLNNASHFRGNPKTNVYVFGGYSYIAADVDVDALRGTNPGTAYTYGNVNFTQSRSDIRDAVKGIMDMQYESNAGVLNGHRDDALPFRLSSKNWLFRHALSAGGGIAWKLSNKVNIGIEQRFTGVFNGDDLDGLNLGRSSDLLSYTSGRININIGSSARNIQPLWWLNPNNFIYNEINRPQHMKLPTPVLPDADGDGITDQFDMEPNTPAGVPVDARGVAKDTDMDGVPDYKDKELLTPQRCFPVDADGVGNCPEPACCVELRNRIDSGMIGRGNCGISNLPTVQFRAGSASLSRDAQAVLTSAAAQIKANPTCRIRVTGHGASDKRAQQLSWDRVNAVIRYFVERQGVGEDRFIFDYGTEGDVNTVDLMGTTEEGPNSVPAPHPNLRSGGGSRRR